MLAKYTRLFLKLRTDKGRDRYPAITNHRAPHKPFLLLSVMDLIAEGLITKNLIQPSLELPEDRDQRSEISNRRNELDGLEQLRMVLVDTYFALEIQKTEIRGQRSEISNHRQPRPGTRGSGRRLSSFTTTAVPFAGSGS